MSYRQVALLFIPLCLSLLSVHRPVDPLPAWDRASRASLGQGPQSLPGGLAVGPSRLCLLTRHQAVKGQAGPGLQEESVVPLSGWRWFSPSRSHVRPGKHSPAGFCPARQGVRDPGTLVLLRVGENQTSGAEPGTHGLPSGVTPWNHRMLALDGPLRGKDLLAQGWLPNHSTQ